MNLIPKTKLRTDLMEEGDTFRDWQIDHDFSDQNAAESDAVLLHAVLPVTAALVLALKAMVLEEESANPGADGHMLRTAKLAIASYEALSNR